MAFEILDHLDKLEPDGGTNDPRGDHSYKCPACGSNNFKVNVKNGYWNTYGCDCASTENGKRKIRNAISPAKDPNDINPIPTAKPKRPTQHRGWEYFDKAGNFLFTVHRWDDHETTSQRFKNGRCIRQTFSPSTEADYSKQIWKNAGGQSPADLKHLAMPYGWKDAKQALADGAAFVPWVEGEPCVDALRAQGLFAVTSLGGCSGFVPERDGPQSTGIPSDRLCVVPDRDKAGIKYADKVSAAYENSRRFYPFKDTPEWNGSMPNDGGLDIADWIQLGGTAVKLAEGIESPPQVESDDHKVPADLEDLGYTKLLDEVIKAIKASDVDREMVARSEVKTRFRVSDDRINTDLFLRLGESKVKKVKQPHGCVDMSKVKALSYLMDGWIQQGDVSLTYGSYGTGKTTLGLLKAYGLATGVNILDRSQPCTPMKSLIIATDSGLAPLYKSMDDLGLDPENDPIFIAGHSDQMIHVWGHDASQGHGAWICDIRGVIKLEQYIKQHDIKYVLIDSAKSVSSAAGWSYTSNEAVKALLKFLLEAIARPLGCCIEFLSHDGTAKGSHSGAKAWAEDPSMVCLLEVFKDEESDAKEVQITFRKDRAAPPGQGIRQFRYYLEDCELKVKDSVEVVGNCGDAVLEVLWEAHQRGVDSLRTGELIDEVFVRFKKTRKTVENSFPSLMVKGSARMIRPRRGRYALSPSEIQARSSSLYRGLYVTGGGLSKSIDMTEEIQPPDQYPDAYIGGNANTPNPLSGETSGGLQTPVVVSDLALSPPVKHGLPKEEPDPMAVVAKYPDLLPAQLANKIYAETGINMSGARVKELMTEHSIGQTLADLDW